MWDCIKCGCRAIAASLGLCPMCRKEREMPKVSAGGPSSRFAKPGETGYIDTAGESADEVQPAVADPSASEPAAQTAPAAPESPQAPPKPVPVPSPAPPRAAKPAEAVSEPSEGPGG